jgi:MFS family permease
MMKFRVRYLLVMLIFVVSAVVNLDRTNIAIAGSYLAVDYHITNVQLGSVFSAFMLGYAAFQIPAGWIVGKLGPRKTLTGGIIWWSVLSVATALVPSGMAHALWALIAVRFLLGIGEAVAYPSANQFIAAWFPSHERGKANAGVQAGAQLGSGTAPPLVAFIIYNFGWHAAFYACALIGLLVAAAWYWAARDIPGQHPMVMPEEMAHIQAGLPVQMEGAKPPVPWARIFTSKDTWGTALAYVGFGYTATIFHTWFFIYLKEGHVALHRHHELLPRGRRHQRLAGQTQKPVYWPQPVRCVHDVFGGHHSARRQPRPELRRGGAAIGGRRGRALSGSGGLLCGGCRPGRAVYRRGFWHGQHGWADRGRGDRLPDTLLRI